MIYKMCAGDMSRFFIIYIIYLLGLAQGKKYFEDLLRPQTLYFVLLRRARKLNKKLNLRVGCERPKTRGGVARAVEEK